MLQNTFCPRHVQKIKQTGKNGVISPLYFCDYVLTLKQSNSCSSQLPNKTDGSKLYEPCSYSGMYHADTRVNASECGGRANL